MMQGKDLYALYAEAMSVQGITLVPWHAMFEQNRTGWDVVAAHVELTEAAVELRAAVAEGQISAPTRSPYPQNYHQNCGTCVCKG